MRAEERLPFSCRCFFFFFFFFVRFSCIAACPTGWQSTKEGKCVLLVKEEHKWSEAEAYCSSHTSHLASVSSEEELVSIQTLCANETRGCWVGGREVNSTDGLRWKWSDLDAEWNSSLFIHDSSLAASPDCLTTTCSQSPNCTLVGLNGRGLGIDGCNFSHPFLCTLTEGSRCEHKSCHKEYNVILAVVSVLIFTTTCGVAVWLLLSRQINRLRKPSKSANVALVSPSWKVFTFNELKASTKNFSDGNKLGNDSRSGRTYRGVLADGSLVAIKRLNTGNFKWKDGHLSQNKNYQSANEQEFLAEVGRIARYRHPNLVVIRGCCFKHGQKYIVYDFMPNGPLDKWLHNLPRGAKSLDWETRMKIAVTLAQGIAFLHEKVRPHVVHGDIRSSNVLLDEEFGAHILGVGLGKPVAPFEGRGAMAGTYGYLAPELVYRNELTTKSDVYSFGVLLLELLSGRAPVRAAEEDSLTPDWLSIFEWATPLAQSGRFEQLLDPSLAPPLPTIAEIQKVIDLVYACTQLVPSMRPRMSFAVHQLQQLPAPTLLGDAVLEMPSQL